MYVCNEGWAIKLALARRPLMIYCASPLADAMIITSCPAYCTCTWKQANIARTGHLYFTCTRYESLETRDLPFVSVFVCVRGKDYSFQNKHMVADVSSNPAPFFRQKSTWSSLHTFLPLTRELHRSSQFQVHIHVRSLLLMAVHSTVLASVSQPPCTSGSSVAITTCQEMVHVRPFNRS
jgi:hypothetical protein